MNQQEACRHCGRQIRGRVDKAYCNNDCRTAYHNKRRRENKEMRFNGSLELVKKNRQLLKFLYALQEPADVDCLLSMGFSFHLYSHELVHLSGKKYRFCLDHGYRINKGRVLIEVFDRRVFHEA